MQPRISSSSDAFSRRVEAAIPEALPYLPASFSSALRDRVARELVERVLAAGDQEGREAANGEPCLPGECAADQLFAMYEDASAELARLRAVEDALRRVEQLTRARPELTHLHEIARSALSEPAAVEDDDER